MLSMSQSAVVWAGLAAGLVLCTAGVARGTLTVGDAVLFVAMVNQLYVPLTYFGSYYRQVQKALIDMENMFGLLQQEPRVKDPPPLPPPAAAAPGAAAAPPALRVVAGSIAFDHVTFSYSPGALPTLRDVDFHIAGGRTLALVGATGSGKSTILRLLLRFYGASSRSSGVFSASGCRVTDRQCRLGRDHAHQLMSLGRELYLICFAAAHLRVHLRPAPICGKQGPDTGIAQGAITYLRLGMPAHTCCCFWRALLGRPHLRPRAD